MKYPNNTCGECPTWLAFGEPESTNKNTSIYEHCAGCELFNSQKFVRHISTQCCYPLEDDGKTVIICGAHLTPEIDNKFWEYVDKDVEKVVVASDPYANHR